MNKSRRSFLKVAGLSVFALSSGLATMAGSAQAGARIGSYEPNAKALKAKRWAMVIDTRAFKNAKEYAPIIEACHKAHNVPTMEGHQDIKWMWLEKFDHAFPDDLNEHLTSRVKDASYPLLCNHCTNPPCVRVCPTQATYQMEDGIIAMDYHRCIGCRFCMAGCPFGARSFNFVDPRKYLSDPVPNPAYPTRMIGVVEKCTFCAERHDVEPPKWIKPLIYLSILWAFSIHTVTAFLYAGIPGRHYWLTAIMAARFLSSAFCSGPAILLLLIFIVRRLTGFDPGRDAIKTLTTIITYAMCINVFFYLLEVFTAFYSGIPGHQHPLVFLFAGHEGHVSWVTNWMWAAVVMAAASLIILIPPQWRTGPLLPLALVLLVAASWIDKGLGLLIGGFTPNMFETVTEYAPTGREIIVALGVYAVGALVLSLLWKIALGVKRETGHFSD